MLLTVNGPRTTRELAELIKALMDWSAESAYGDLDDVLTQVAKRFHITVSDQQRDQVYAAVADALPADTGDGEDPTADVTAWVAARLPYEPQVLSALLMNSWMDLCSQAEAEATRANEERERAERDPIAEAIRHLTLTGRYYVVAHNGRGKPLLSEAVIGLGLAAGAVAELIIAGRIGVEIRTHQLVDGSLPENPPGTPDTEASPPPAPSQAAEGALEDLRKQTVPLRDQLSVVAAGIEERVRAELLESGLITPETRGMLRERVYYAPVPRGLAKAIRALVGGALYSDPIPSADAVLAELAIATGLDAKQTGGWDRLSSMNRGDALAKTRRAETAAQLKLLVDLTAAEVDAVVISPGS
ncbi:GPP34 family phosphoprotein [Actinospica durhamensis]|uniref:GPP34 family phosphoprotein n=1 Tax=Actinospica durhamensis TaxID=1508375 RepID=A0A941EYR4_9ACTN|nr:GPP34 family phosphoprotein [Actinospica durhamensis]MBR7838968.1 GPP34 family phosphoprotein [Actinospica durhamensis]